MAFLELRLVDHVYLFSDAILHDNSTTVRLLTSKDQVKGCGQVLAPVALKELILLPLFWHCSLSSHNLWRCLMENKEKENYWFMQRFFPGIMNNRTKQLHQLYSFKMDLCTRLFYLCITENIQEQEWQAELK